MPNNESANELFHFTSKYDYIKSILNDKFKPFFCVEDSSYMFKEGRNMIFAHPMVCFCDIPLERILVHREQYGDYGIGLKKEWGRRNFLSIVNYTHNRSLKAAGNRILVEYYKKKCKGLSDKLSDSFGNALRILLMLTKPYEGKRYNKEDRTWSEGVVRFYNEREWRYIPEVDKLIWTFALNDYSDNYEAFHKAFQKEQVKIQKQHTLSFSVDDVTHIFLKDESEKKKLLTDISSNYKDEELKKIERLICVNNNSRNKQL